MELLIAGGIALMGYNMAPARRDAPQGRYAAQLGPSNEYSSPGNDTRALTQQHMALAEKRWREARDPALTGIVTPHTKLTNAMLPFFRSAKQQNTNDVVKQTRMEAFTGATAMDSSLTGTYRRKREVEAMFGPAAPAGPVTSSGTVGNPMYTRDDARFQPGAVHNNVMPAQQTTVGRGVGVGPDVAAADGFHPLHRVLHKNVGDYKKNNLPGQVNHGAAPTATPGAAPKTSVNHNPGSLVYDQDRRPLLPGRAAVLAPSEHPQLTSGTLKRPRATDEDRFGAPAGPAGFEQRGFTENRVGYEGRDHGDRNHSLPPLNATGAAAGVGAFTHYAYDGARLGTQQRETRGGNGFLTGPVARQMPSSILVQPTQRGAAAPYVGGGGAGTRGGQAARLSDQPRVTLRDTQGDNAALFGTRAAVQGGTLDNVWRYDRLGRQAIKRPVTEGRPMPGRMNVQFGAGAVATREDDERRMAPGQRAMPTPSNPSASDSIGRLTTPSNKLSPENPRLDLGLAAEQLRTNPYATSLWSVS